MAESMVEKVATAIALEHLDPETRAAVDRNEWFVAESYFDLARAAIEAMREPTDGMLTAGLIQDATVDRYRAMIDAALNEEAAG